jgi:hypothetical protein
MNGYTYLAVAGQPTIGLNSTNNTLTIQPAGGISITTNAVTNTVTLNTSGSITDLTVTNSLTANPTVTGAINNVVIGATAPSSGTFNGLTALSTVNFSPANANITISPTGTGTLTVNPAVTGNINNVIMGAINPASATFTILSATGNVAFNGNNANTTISPTGTGTVAINPAVTGSINNMSLGLSAPLAGRFTTVRMTTQPGVAQSAVTVGYARALAAAYGMIMS